MYQKVVRPGLKGSQKRRFLFTAGCIAPPWCCWLGRCCRFRRQGQTEPVELVLDERDVEGRKGLAWVRETFPGRCWQKRGVEGRKGTGSLVFS